MGNLINLGKSELISDNLYEPFSYESSIANPGGEILNISGSGFLSHSVVNCAAQESRLRITVDGVILYHGNLIDSNNTHGITSENNLIVKSTETVVSTRRAYSVGVGQAASPGTYPYNNSNETDGNGRLIFIDSPIYFENSLVIEGFSNITLNYSIRGGLLT